MAKAEGASESRWFKVGFWLITSMVGIIVALVGVSVRTTVGGVEQQVTEVERDVEELSHSNGKAHGEIIAGLKEQNGNVRENSKRILVNEMSLKYQAEIDNRVEGRLGVLEANQRRLEDNQGKQMRLLEKIDKKLPPQP